MDDIYSNIKIISNIKKIGYIEIYICYLPIELYLKINIFLNNSFLSYNYILKKAQLHNF